MRIGDKKANQPIANMALTQDISSMARIETKYGEDHKRVKNSFVGASLCPSTSAEGRYESPSRALIKGSGDFGVNAVNDRLQRLEHGTDLLTCVFEMELRQTLKRRGVV